METKIMQGKEINVTTECTQHSHCVLQIELTIPIVESRTVAVGVFKVHGGKMNSCHDKG